MASFCCFTPVLQLGSCQRTPFHSTNERICGIPHNNEWTHSHIARQSMRATISRKRWWNYFKCKHKNSEVHLKQEKPDLSRATLIWRAIKLPIYSVAIIPLTVASASAYLETGHFLVNRYLALLVSSMFIITWLNLSNDVYDFDTGADKNKLESVVNIVGSRTGTLAAANLLLAVGLSGLAWVALDAGSVRSILLLLCAVVCGYIYQCPPFRLSYQGLGEPLCFAAFGPFATSAFYLMQITSREIYNHQPITSTILSASILIGCTTTLILFCSHFHQIEGDKEVGKISPLVRIGQKAGSKVVKIAVVALYVVLFVLGIRKSLPLVTTVLCGLTLPMGNSVISFVEKNYDDNERIFMAKYYCVRLHALFGLALAAGLVAARRFGKYAPVTMFP
ncbi:2-carboxy-1,4-naphthoquinone phytyltransferase, chloroplastic [Silene latifolia]|uniref:2-carboxy-1,4-naphthoquinone phytyltransferase, chloroplastic n=1 Tax=Silene latifolia TaxID=37657 RepID=UPI003D7778B1